MGQDHDRDDAGQFEWVNAWAQASKATVVAAAEPAASAAPANAAVASADPVGARAAPPEDQLMRDIAEIERTRDVLAAMPLRSFSAKRRTQALMLVPARTADPVPVVIGGVLALVMLTVFGAAAAMTKLAR
jgi:hypothetical protein